MRATTEMGRALPEDADSLPVSPYACRAMHDPSDRRPAAARDWIDRLLARRTGRRDAGAGRGLLETCLGPLELRVLESLWRRAGEAGVRAFAADFPGTAYTTLMTTLDRLFKKGLLLRRKQGRAYVYSARYGRGELESVLARDAIDELLHGQLRRGRAEPLLSGIVEAVGRRDLEMLDELERLVRRRRSAAGRVARGEQTE